MIAHPASKHLATMEKTVAALFAVEFDGDGEVHFELKALASDSANALAKTGILLETEYEEKGMLPIHPSMTMDNNYTFFGSRKDCGDSTPYNHTWQLFGGFVIEIMTVE